MKKLTAILLVLVLLLTTSATTLANGQEATEVGNFNNGSGTTEVKLVTDGGQVSATVPLKVTLAVAANGAVTGPTDYTITNTSVMPIKVSNVAITPETGFVTTDAAGTKIGAITLTDGQGGDATALSAWSVAKTSAAWNMATGGTITLSFSGSVTGITQNITTATKAFSIVFTIVAGANA